VKVSNDRMRGSLFSSCKISLLFRFEVFPFFVELIPVQMLLINPNAFLRTISFVPRVRAPRNIDPKTKMERR
jgi:hypothetical protein